LERLTVEGRKGDFGLFNLDRASIADPIGFLEDLVLLSDFVDVQLGVVGQVL
jgi:hypothetical protein